MKNKKKGKIILGCVAGVVIVVVLFIVFLLPKKQSLHNITGELQTLADGSYEGECSNGIVMAKVEVTVKDHAITDIKILEHRNGRGEAAESIIFDVVKAQNVEVDTISGATMSSYTILKAIENAVEQ